MTLAPRWRYAVLLAAGTPLDVECDHVNTTSATVL